jgi:CTP:molybdopterin cytidylyltransferase MocA
LPIEILDNPDFGEGIAASIRSAARWAKQRACQALVLALCDQPKLTAAHLDRLILEYERHHLPIASRYCGKNAVPALFPETSFNELQALCGDIGASALLNGEAPVVSIPWPDGELDVDSPDAARRLQANSG